MNIFTKIIASRSKKESDTQFSVKHPRKILFDHLPKCGGSTLNEYLVAHYPQEEVFCTDGFNLAESLNYFKELPEHKRHGYSLVKGHLANKLIDYVHPECLKVTVLRDPVERIISHYYYVKRTPNHYLYSAIQDSELSLEDYAASNLSCELQNWYTTHFSGLSLAQAEESPEDSISKAAEALWRQYDIVGFLEDFPSFIEKLRKRANLRNEYQDNRINVTQDRPKLKSIPVHVIQKIEQVNYLDIAFYKKVKNTVAGAGAGSNLIRNRV